MMTRCIVEAQRVQPDRESERITPHILVVDDDPSVRRTLERALDRRGYRVSTAADGCSALELFDIQGADLVILDVKMADMDGIEVCQSIKRTKDVPVIILTGARNRMVVESLPQLADGAGADAYLRKPLDMSDLNDVVSNFLPER